MKSFLQRLRIMKGNIYTWDVTLAMGAEIPHWVNGNECLVPDMKNWLSSEEGIAAGWRSATEAEAIANANTGRPTVSLVPDKNVQVVRPQLYAGVDVMVAQAGLELYSYGPMGWAYGFSQSSLEEALYYVHD